MFWPQLPDYGCFPRWPADGQDWIHPDDVAIVRRCLPSERVVRRESFDGTYYHFSYGDVRFRLRPCLWLKVDAEGLDLGDCVETIGVGMERELFVAHVCGMHYVRRKGRILYRLRRGDRTVRRLYTADQLRLLDNKAKVRGGEIEHPVPRWSGSGARMEGLEL